MSLSESRITALPPPPGTHPGAVVRYYTDTARAELGDDWDLELIPLKGKNPRINGAAWQDLASSDPATLMALLTRAPRADGIGALMNRHIAFDVDCRPALPPGLASIIEAGLENKTRDDRSHYIFRVPVGLRFGGSKVRLDPSFGARAKWGEIKAWNSQIRIWSPNSDGSHVALVPGVIPELPAVLTGLLLPPLAPGDMATDGELDDFLAEHTGESRIGWLSEDLERFSRDTADMSKYEAVVKRQLQLAINSAAGLYPAQLAYDRLLDSYRSVCLADSDWDESERVAKYRTAWRGAVAKVTRDPDLIASIEEKRRGTGAVPWDPEHDDGDAMLAEWFGDWAASWGVEPGSGAIGGAGIMDLMSAADSDAEAAGSGPPVTAPAPGDGSAGSVSEADDRITEDVSGSVGSPVSDSSAESSLVPAVSPAEADVSKYDLYMQWLIANDRELVESEVKKQMIREAAGQQLRIIHGGGPVAPRRLDLSRPRVIAGPTILPLAGRSDGMGLFYPGTITNLIGDKSAGKSWLLMAMALSEIRRWIASGLGLRVAWMDWEMMEDRFAERCSQMRMTQQEVDRFDYFEMGSATFDDARGALNRMPSGSVLVLDSVSRALASEMGVSGEGGEEDNTAYVSWISRVAGMRSSRNMSMFLIEHTGHTNKHRGRGASAKGQQADCEFTMDVVGHWNREASGWAALTCRKDRSGFLVENIPAYGAFFEPLGDGELDVEVRELTEWERVFAGEAALPDDEKRAHEKKERREAEAEERMDVLEAKVLDAVTGARVPLSRREIATRLRASRPKVNDAVTRLVGSGQLVSVGGAGAHAKVRLPGPDEAAGESAGEPDGDGS